MSCGSPASSGDWPCVWSDEDVSWGTLTNVRPDEPLSGEGGVYGGVVGADGALPSPEPPGDVEPVVDPPAGEGTG